MIFASTLSLLLLGCGGTQLSSDGGNTEPETTPTPVESTDDSSSDVLSATFKTTEGDIVIQLFADKAPTIVDNFVNLAKAGKYDGTIFHRVIEDFMIQGGDYENFNGTGGQAFVGGMIADEFGEGLSHVKGTLSMANRGPNTNGSQFFIMHGEAPHLDGRHAIFGQVTDGMDIVDNIATTETALQDRPVEDIVVETIEIQ